MGKKQYAVVGFNKVSLEFKYVFIQIDARASISYKWFLTQHVNESGVYSTPVFISYCSLVQGRMARASTSVYEFDRPACF